MIDNTTNKSNEINLNDVEFNGKTVVDTAMQDIYEDYVTNENVEKPFKIKAIRAVSRVSSQLNDTWYSFEFSETREILDDSKISEIRADLWNTVNGEVDNQVQYTIDSILGKIPVAQPVQTNVEQTQQSNLNYSDIPEQYNY